MARRKNKLKTRKKKQAKKPSIPQVGNLKTLAAPVEVDNPHFSRDHMEGNGNRRKITAMMNMKESITAHWWHRELIELPEYQAATRFRAIWERSGGTGASAFDYSIEKVDGGTQSDPVSVSRAQAVSELVNVRLRYGEDAYNLLIALCGQCQPISNISPSKRKQQKQSEKCRELLASLAVDFGYRKHVDKEKHA